MTKRPALVVIQSDVQHVYLARYPKDHPNGRNVFYVGYAGKRGVLKRLCEYRDGSDLNGFGVVVLDLALGDRKWIGDRLREVETQAPRSAVEWMRLSIEWLNPEVQVLFTDSKEEAKKLEDELIDFHESTLLNRAVVRKRKRAAEKAKAL